MAFSGGGSNDLKPHTHNSLTLLDGGSLDMRGVTQSSMSNGSLTYSNTAHLQELSIGTPTHVLTVSAGNLPVWSAMAPGGATCSDSLTISGQTNTLCKWLELAA